MPWRVPEIIPLPRDFRGFDPTGSIAQHGFSRYTRHLPHWRLEGACYFVTFRLDDSIPTSVEQKMRRELDQWHVRLAAAGSESGGRLPPEVLSAWDDFQRARLRKLESVLDECHGECVLRDPLHRGVVTEALRHFEGERCEMLAYAIMPNHVHALCRPLGQHQLEDLCGSWKWFTAQRIHRTLGRQGSLRQEENFDWIIRDAAHYANTVRYIAKNPAQAKLREDEAEVWLCDAIREANGWE